METRFSASEQFIIPILYRVSECEAFLEMNSMDNKDAVSLDYTEHNVSYLSRICKIDGKR